MNAGVLRRRIEELDSVKQNSKVVLLFFILSLLIGCAPSANVRNSKGENINVKLMEPYNGPRARIAVSRFDAKAAKIPPEVADGLSDMLATALVNTNRFIVLERDALKDVIREQDLGTSGRLNPKSAPAVGQIEGAELLVMGAITEYEPMHFSFGGITLGVLTGATSVILNQKNSHIPLSAIMYTDAIVGADIRVVDTRTSRILFSASFSATAKDFGGGIIAVIGGGKTRTPLGFGGFQHTGIKLAMRALIEKAVAFIAMNTPRNFYHYVGTSTPVPQLIPIHAVPYGQALLKQYPPKSEYVFDNYAAWKKFASTYFKNGDSILVSPDLFRNEKLIAAFPKTKTLNADVEIRKAVDRVSFIEVMLTERDVPPPKVEKGEKIPLSYVLASIPAHQKPVYFSRKVFGGK